MTTFMVIITVYGDFYAKKQSFYLILLVLANGPILGTNFRFFDPRQMGFDFKLQVL